VNAQGDLPVLDLGRAIRDLGDSEALYAELAGIFMQDLPAMRSRLESAAGEGAPTSLIAAIHELANSFGIVGASRGAAAARQLEACLLRVDGTAHDQALRIASAELASAAKSIGNWLAER
jgi:HPt (histidine-containing phosphotransfer) domain-containing protein